MRDAHAAAGSVGFGFGFGAAVVGACVAVSVAVGVDEAGLVAGVAEGVLLMPVLLGTGASSAPQLETAAITNRVKMGSTRAGRSGAMGRSLHGAGQLMRIRGVRPSSC